MCAGYKRVTATYSQIGFDRSAFTRGRALSGAALSLKLKESSARSSSIHTLEGLLELPIKTGKITRVSALPGPLLVKYAFCAPHKGRARAVLEAINLTKEA